MAPTLSGIRVVDMTIAYAGPVATGILGSLGAEVIKLESTQGRGGQARRDPGDLRARRMRSMELSHNKLGIALNLTVPQAVDVFRRLVAISDVVLDNFSPRVMHNFGLEYEDLRSIKPDIIVVSMPAFGKNGPWRDFTSFGPGIDAMSGLAYMTGYRDGMPLKPGNMMCDYNAGAHAAFAVLTALFHRKRTGQGQSIEVAMRDGESQLVGDSILDYILNHRVHERVGNEHPAMAPHNVYPCWGEDQWVAIAVENDGEWAALCEIMGHPEMGVQGEFSTLLERKRSERRIDEIIANWTKDQDHQAVMHRLQAAGIPAAAVMTTAEIADDPQFRHRRAFPEVEVKGGGSMRLPRPGWLAQRATLDYSRGPDFSEHTESVLRDLLHFTTPEIETLVALGATVLPQAGA